MNLLPLATLLQDAQLGILGESVFVDQIPATCARGVMVRNRRPGAKIDYNLPGYLKSTIQLIVRSQDYQDGQTLINQAVLALTFMGKQVGDMYFNFCRPTYTPVPYPSSEGNFIEWACPLDVNFVIE